MVLGNMGVHRVPKEARNLPEDGTMDDKVQFECCGHSDAQANAGGYAGYRTPRTSGTNSG